MLLLFCCWFGFIFFFFQCLASVSTHSTFLHYEGKQDHLLFSFAICTKARFPWNMEPFARSIALVEMKLEL